jgi:two-component system, OmpR family, phosphate regulon response regulator PhoB
MTQSRTYDGVMSPSGNGTVRRILVVDDEPMVREVLVGYLERDGYVVDQADTGPAALELAESSRPDLILLDVMLPEVDGFAVLTRIRQTSAVPVILLTARSDEPDRVVGLELGADDYVVKPFSPREVVARVRSVLRRASVPRLADRLEFDGLVIDGSSREVHVNGTLVDLTPKEFELLAYLASTPRAALSRSVLLENVWDSSVDYQDPSTVTVHVARLRQKIEIDPDSPRWITTVRGVGYRFEP